MDEMIPDSFCPLCGVVGQLRRGRVGDKIVRYCKGVDGTLTAETSHTCQIVGVVESKPRRKSAAQEVDDG
jgi:hypothetical protein